MVVFGMEWIILGVVIIGGLYLIPKYAAPIVRKWMNAGKEIQQVIKDERKD